MTVCKFRYHRAVIRFGFVRDEIFKLQPGTIIGVIVKSDAHNQQKFSIPEFIVFQAHVTPKFEVEQVGSGFPCKDEAKAKEVYQVVVAKNLIVPIVVLVTWDGGFALATASNPEAWYDELVLFCYNKPQIIGEQLSKFSLKYFKRSMGKPPEMVKEEMLPTIEPVEAEKLFQQKSAQIKADELAKIKKISPSPSTITQPSVALKESQLLVLSKAFPETIKFFKSTEKPSPQDVYAAYQRDIFKATGKMDEPLTFNQDQFTKAVKVFNNKRRRTKMGIDPIEYELVAGWFFSEYGNMPPHARVNALKKRGLHPPTADAIRQMCKRLKLPSIRKPGLH
ncbi:MAG TPA: hypothetical protein VK742_07500 [Candidatus Sulfotelmatobacter sp.]|nr:hypothetical protein [Candidatus Sulfotelmatobacter sp.]